MKKLLSIICLGVLFQFQELNAVVKIFINDSNKVLIVRVYGINKDITCARLTPGKIQEMFIPSDVINKIIIAAEDETKHFSSMGRQTLYKEQFAINENTICMIRSNGSVKFYKETGPLVKILQQIDQVYQTEKPLPAIEISIHRIKTDNPGVFQDVQYSLQYPKSFLNTLSSVFS